MEDKDLEAIHRRLDELEKLIKTVKGEGIIYKISIERAEFNSPIVEHLDYHFDKLDVKEVSGALNLGNNFGVTVGQAIKKKNAEEDIAEEDIAEEDIAEEDIAEEDIKEEMTKKESETERQQREAEPESERRETSATEEQKAQAFDQGWKRPSPSSEASSSRQMGRTGNLSDDEKGEVKADQTNKRHSVHTSVEAYKPNHSAASNGKSREIRKASPQLKTTFRSSTDSSSPPFKIAFFPRGNKQHDQNDK